MYARDIDPTVAAEHALSNEVGPDTINGVEGYLASLYYEADDDQYTLVTFTSRADAEDVQWVLYRLLPVKRGGQR